MAMVDADLVGVVFLGVASVPRKERSRSFFPIAGSLFLLLSGFLPCSARALKLSAKAAEHDMAKSAAWPEDRNGVDWSPQNSLDPIVMLGRTKGVVKSEIGRTEVALAEAQENCAKRTQDDNVCESDKDVMKIRGKLNRLRMTSEMFGKMNQDAESFHTEEQRARLELRNATELVEVEETYLGRHMRADARLRHDMSVTAHRRDALEQDLSVQGQKVHAQEQLAAHMNEKQQQLRRLSVLMASVLRGTKRGIDGSNRASDLKLAAAQIKLRKARQVEANAEALMDRAKVESASAEAIIRRQGVANTNGMAGDTSTLPHIGTRILGASAAVTESFGFVHAGRDATTQRAGVLKQGQEVEAVGASSAAGSSEALGAVSDLIIEPEIIGLHSQARGSGNQEATINQMLTDAEQSDADIHAEFQRTSPAPVIPKPDAQSEPMDKQIEPIVAVGIDSAAVHDDHIASHSPEDQLSANDVGADSATWDDTDLHLAGSGRHDKDRLE